MKEDRTAATEWLDVARDGAVAHAAGRWRSMVGISCRLPPGPRGKDEEPGQSARLAPIVTTPRQTPTLPLAGRGCNAGGYDSRGCPAAPEVLPAARALKRAHWASSAAGPSPATPCGRTTVWQSGHTIAGS